MNDPFEKFVNVERGNATLWLKLFLFNLPSIMKQPFEGVI